MSKMPRLSAETLHEKIESQREIIEQLQKDNKALTESAVKLLDRVEDLKEESRAKDAQILALQAQVKELSEAYVRAIGPFKPAKNEDQTT